MFDSYHKGIIIEDGVVQYLIRRQYQILARRYKTKHGEVDIIAQDVEDLCMIEVKYRKCDPEYAVSERQQRRIIDTAEVYLAECYKPDALPVVRFDVICVSKNAFQHYKHAFTA